MHAYVKIASNFLIIIYTLHFYKLPSSLSYINYITMCTKVILLVCLCIMSVTTAKKFETKIEGVEISRNALSTVSFNKSGIMFISKQPLYLNLEYDVDKLLSYVNLHNIICENVMDMKNEILEKITALNDDIGPATSFYIMRPIGGPNPCNDCINGSIYNLMAKSALIVYQPQYINQCQAYLISLHMPLTFL